MRCTQQPLPFQFYYDYFSFDSLLLCPPFAAFVVAVCELDSLDGTTRMTIRTNIITTIFIMGLFSFIFGCSKQDAATTFPSDENGDILRQMAAQGDDFSKPRDINFSFVFSTESDGKAFVEQVRAMPGLKVEGPTFPDELKKWDTTVTKNMLPTHQDITALEQSLSRIAESHSGKADGWGCFVVKK